MLEGTFLCDKPEPRYVPMRSSVTSVVFTFSLLVFLLIACSTISPVDEPVGAIDLALSEEYLERAGRALEEQRIHEAYIYLLKSLERNPENLKSRMTLENLNESLVSESHFIKEPITRGRGLERPLSFFLYHTAGEEVLPVPDVSVRFGFIEGTGALTEEAVTNDAGLAKCYVERIDTYEKGITIEAIPYVEYNSETVSLRHLAQQYVFSTVSLLEQIQHVYVLFDNPDRNVNSEQFAYMKNSLIRLFHENEFNEVQFHYMTEEILFNRALELDRSSIGVLTDSDMLFLVQVQTAFLSQQSVDFFFSGAQILLQIIDTKAPRIVFSEEVSRRGAGRTRELSAYQAVVNAVNDIARQLDLYLKEARRIYGV